MTMADATPTDDRPRTDQGNRPEAGYTARSLACAVIGLAWQDAFARADSGWSEPRQFFERDTPLLRMWCEWAGVDPDAVREAFRRRMAADSPTAPARLL
jgi:hypothetical protein